MIKAIPDTNIILRGMFGYKSDHRKVLSLSTLKKIQLYGCTKTFEEFCEKVYLERFQRFWKPKIFSPEKVVLDYKSFMMMHEPTIELEEPIPIEDPDDAIFFELALSLGIKIIISEDKHLIKLNKYQEIHVISASKFIDVYTRINGSLGLGIIKP